MVEEVRLQAVAGVLAANGITITTGSTGITGVAGLAGGEGGGSLIYGSSLTGTTINGEALSVSVGGTDSGYLDNQKNVSQPKVSVVIAQYN
jgi:hypothetical protein